MSEILDPLQIELAAALRNNDGQLGKVFVLLEEGKVTNRELAEGGGAANPGAAANLRVTVKAVLDGVLPKGPTVAAQARRSIGGLLRDNPDLSTTARAHLEDLRTSLEDIANDTEALEREAHHFEEASQVLKKSLEKSPGVYVFTLPSFMRTVQMTDPDRFWFKIGKTDRAAGVRIGEIMKITGLPEDPWCARVYRHKTLTPKDLESTFHDLLKAAGHSRAPGKNAGRDWYATNLDFLDAIGSAMDCEISENQPPEDI
jgi:hypothetical protein